MYAIVEIAGQQFKVAKDQKVFVHRLAGKEGDQITFDKVLLLSDGKVTIGAPVIKGAAITAKIVSHVKGDKVIVFKKKRRKGYRVKNGHRQAFSEIQIESIVASGHKPAKEKKETAKPAAPKTKVKKDTAKQEVKKPATKIPKTSSKTKSQSTAKKQTSKSETKPAPKKAPAKKVAKADDLKKIEGIGPKIANIFVENGIDTFTKLAATKVDKLKDLLKEAGSRYASKNPDSWPKQAKMAAEGKWEELKEWQEKTKRGIE